VGAVELKTLIKYGNGREEKYPHGVELELSAAGREEVKKRFAGSPVTLVSLATSEHTPWPDAAVEKKAIEDTKGYVKLSHDVGSRAVRVLPNNWLKDQPKEKTFDALAAFLNDVGKYADGMGQEISLEAHGGIGELPYVKQIMDRVKAKSVRVRLNSEKRNTVGEGGIDGQFSLIRPWLSRTMHIHNLKLPNYPYQEVIDWLVKAGWDGWAFLEVSDKVPDRVAGLAEQRELWDKMVESSLKRLG
jgi:sugar phosphate isomerase/epimerase